jgi:hypothetical protein
VRGGGELVHQEAEGLGVGADVAFDGGLTHGGHFL